MAGYNIYTDPRYNKFLPLPPKPAKPMLDPIHAGMTSHLDPKAPLTKLVIPTPTPTMPYVRPPMAEWMNQPSKFNTGISRTIGQNNPIAEYQRVLNQQHFDGTDRRSQYMANQFGQSQNDWKAALLDHPDLDYRDFLKSYMGNPMSDFLKLSAAQRGLNNASRVSVVRPG